MTGCEKFFYSALALALIAVLAGCSTGKAFVDACRDGLCR